VDQGIVNSGTGFHGNRLQNSQMIDGESVRPGAV
jgi:hypothetical protein